MPFYELVYITRQDLSSAEVDDLTDSFKKILEDNGGKLVSKEYWGLRTLAYKINKNSRGHYVLMNIDSPYSALKELERVMGFNENVIRKGVFKIDNIPEKNSDLMVSVNAKDYKKS
jgi:small subunit ribosomal protein S6